MELPSVSAGDHTQEYLESYDDIRIHKIMLKDTSRLLAYQRFIEENSEIFVNKVVVDVGCGTGILSLLAARAGARHVRVFVFAFKTLSEYFVEIKHKSGKDLFN